MTNPTNTVYATKRMIGRGIKDEQTQKEMKVRCMDGCDSGWGQKCDGLRGVTCYTAAKMAGASGAAAQTRSAFNIHSVVTRACYSLVCRLKV